MNRTQAKIDKIQREISKLLDVGSNTEATGSPLLPMYLKQAQKALDEAWLLAK